MATYPRHHHENLLRDHHEHGFYSLDSRREKRDYYQRKINWQKKILQQTK